ncbi:MAG: 50S ribosomal protein L25/general stress protein Ctc [Bacteroidia bacterium]|nr:50S ribosomal protein L25/general stress protein Ctc [Bacteroidia bacterium]
MKTIALKGDMREGLGKSATKAVRAEGKVPCVLYGAGETVHFSVYESDFKNLVYTPNTYLVRLDIAGNQVIAKLQDLQFHPVSEAILHADFYALDLAKPVQLSLPIRVTGNSPGVRAGGKLRVKIRKLAVRGLIQDLPEDIEVNIDSVELGKSVRVRELSVPNVELLDTPENSVVSVVVTRAAQSAANAAASEEGAEEATEEEAAE